MDPLTVGLIGGTLVSGLLSYGAEKQAAEAQKEAMGYKADALETQADLAKYQAKLNNYTLYKNFNDTNANQAVIAAAQGRTISGSTEAVMKAGENNLEWDKKYMELTGQYSAAGYKAQAAQTRLAGIEIASSGNESANVSLLNSALKSGQLAGGL